MRRKLPVKVAPLVIIDSIVGNSEIVKTPLGSFFARVSTSSVSVGAVKLVATEVRISQISLPISTSKRVSSIERISSLSKITA